MRKTNKLLTALFVAFVGLFTVATADAASLIPKRVAAAQLSQGGLKHQEVLRIDPDALGPSRDHDIVIDAWTDNSKTEIEELRMWWLDKAKGNERSIFGKTVRKRMKVTYAKKSADKWLVSLKEGSRTYDFDVEIEDGKAKAYGTVITKDGKWIPHCEAKRSNVVPKRTLGIPTGLKRLAVTCVDANGDRHRGKLAYR